VALQPLIRGGLVVIEDQVGTVTEAGRWVVCVITAMLDLHIRVNTARFSKLKRQR
jgi:hypothetical protein